MKKIVSIAAALTLMGSMAAAAGAEEAVTGTVTPEKATEATTPATTTTTPAIEVNKPAVDIVEGKAETVTGATYGTDDDKIFDEPVVKAGEEVLVPTMLLNLLERTWFYDAPNGKPIGALGSQVIDTTGEVVDGFDGGQWVQVYTWKGKAWIHVAIQ
ncbi:hypothetical protein JNUCC31_09785 [Paenibacillus sp. JNUCC31]|uniref:hypothetical protein n=1 Tax=Paenibacillus sp. JNUCC-31 TaxID=2777983 RepID=UPI00177ECDAB|nr:hypothetical protein [Paenibacillus sp. JNUCC-31]QOS81113.1 hypothetical protein JNUCC31_09785 [Paenibacillus sp. JNUCC-31]